MADLSGRLPTEIDSQQRFIQPAKATPSIFESLANFGTGVVGVADRALRSIESGQQGKAAAAETAAKNSAILTINSQLFSDPSVAPQPSNIPPGSESAYSNAQTLAAPVAKAQTAASQGHIDPGMAQVKSIAAFRQALAANPGHEFAVFQAFKEAGVDNMMMQQYKNAETVLESDQTAQQATIHKLQDDAVNKYGYVNFYQKSPDEQAAIMATVGNLNAQEADLEAKTKLADLTLKNVQLTDSQQKQVKQQQSTGLMSSFTTYMTGNFNSLGKMMVNMLGDPDLQNDPARMEKLQSHLMSVSLPALDVAYQTKLAPILPYLSAEDRSALDSQFKTQRQALVDMISGPQSVVESNKRILENISNQWGIDYAKSAPTIMRLQKLIGPQAVGVLLSPSVIGNPALSQMLKNELNGVMQDPSKMPSFTEFVQSLNGSIDPSTWDPEKMRAAAPAALAATNALGRDSAASNGTDKEGHRALLNSIKQTASVAVDVVPQWGFSNILAQGKALNTRGVTTAMFHSGSINQPDKEDAVNAWVPATTRTYMTLAGMSSGDAHYSIHLDPHTLKWGAVWDGKMVTGAGDRVMPGVGTPIPGNVKPQPNSKTLEQVATLNTMLNNLSRAGEGGWDPTLGGKVNYQEARRYFATGEIPESLKKPTTSKNGKTPEQNVDDAVSHMLDFVNNLPKPKPIADLSSMPLAGAVETAAKAHGVPGEIALRLIHQESSGNPNVGKSKKGATGPGQIMPATAAAYGVTDLDSLTPEQNVDLSMRILADNYKKTGNWEDAVAMYHSGRTLAEAVKRGANDGNMSTADYTAGIVGPSSISAENLKRYGYVRF